MYSYCQYIIILTANKMLQFNLIQLQRIKPYKILVLHSTRNQNREPPILTIALGFYLALAQTLSLYSCVHPIILVVSLLDCQYKNILAQANCLSEAFPRPAHPNFAPNPLQIPAKGVVILHWSTVDAFENTVHMRR